MSLVIEKAISKWESFAKYVHPPKNEKEYDEIVHLLEFLLETSDEKNTSTEMLINILTEYIQEYDEMHYPIEESTGIDMLKYLMKEHKLTQKDLPEIGSQGVVSEILRGKRSLNINHIKKLAKRFSVSPATFIDPL